MKLVDGKIHIFTEEFFRGSLKPTAVCGRKVWRLRHITLARRDLEVIHPPDRRAKYCQDCLNELEGKNAETDRQ